MKHTTVLEEKSIVSDISALDLKISRIALAKVTSNWQSDILPWPFTRCYCDRFDDLDLYWSDFLFVPNLWFRKFHADSFRHYCHGNLFLAEWIDPAFPGLSHKSHGHTDVCC